MSTPTIPMSDLVEAMEALALIHSMKVDQPLSFPVWTKVMSAHIRLQSSMAALQPVAVVLEGRAA